MRFTDLYELAGKPDAFVSYRGRRHFVTSLTFGSDGYGLVELTPVALVGEPLLRPAAPVRFDRVGWELPGVELWREFKPGDAVRVSDACPYVTARDPGRVVSDLGDGAYGVTFPGGATYRAARGGFVASTAGGILRVDAEYLSPVETPRCDDPACRFSRARVVTFERHTHLPYEGSVTVAPRASTDAAGDAEYAQMCADFDPRRYFTVPVAPPARNWLYTRPLNPMERAWLLTGVEN